MSETALARARRFAGLGLSIIPIKEGEKTPAITSWRKFQEERATDDDLVRWFGNAEDNGEKNIGIVTGSVSGVVVVDTDCAAAEQWALAHLPSTSMRTRTGKGFHWFFRHPDHEVRNQAGIDVGPGARLDIRGDGGYVVAPGSLHPTGAVYTAEGSWSAVTDLPVFNPRWLPDSSPVSPPATALVISEGARNVRLTSIAGSLRRQGKTEEEILAAIRDENLRRCSPPLADAELTAIARSIARYSTGAAIDAVPLTELFASAGFDSLRAEDPSTDVEAALRALARGLLNADALRCQTARTEAIKRLNAISVQGAARLVDAAMKDARATHAQEMASSGFEDQLADPEPWPDQVDGAVLLNDITALLRRHMVLPDGAAEAIALWVLHTWTFDSSFITPILAICSPEKRCGKSTLFILLRSLVRRALLASNITSSVLFRAIEKWHPTLLIDEADTFLRENEALRGVLNSGHSKRTATIIRNVGDNHEPTAFSTWAPKAIAMIGRLPDTLEDRSVVVGMRRRAPEERVERLRLDRVDGEVVPLRQRAMRWATDHADALRNTDPDVPVAIVSDRARDTWRPLLAIAEQAGGDWPRIASEAAVRLVGREAEGAEMGDGLRLLTDVKQVFDEAREQRLASDAIASELQQIEDSPWPDYSRGQGIKPALVARLLKTFGIRPRKIRFGKDTKQGYDRAWFEDAWRRYVPPCPEHPEHPEQAGRNGLDRPSSSSEHDGRPPEQTDRAPTDGMRSGSFWNTSGLVPEASSRIDAV